MVTDIALDEFRRFGHRRAKPGREIVENEDVLASIEQLEDHMAADEARTTRYQNTHAINLSTKPFAIRC